jgi:hypothetical protein
MNDSQAMPGGDETMADISRRVADCAESLAHTSWRVAASAERLAHVLRSVAGVAQSAPRPPERAAWPLKGISQTGRRVAGGFSHASLPGFPGIIPA